MAFSNTMFGITRYVKSTWELGEAFVSRQTPLEDLIFAIAAIEHLELSIFQIKESPWR